MKGLKIKRLNKHLSQVELGKALNLAGNTISYYEKGEREPKLETLRKMAEYFECSIEELL